MLNNFHNKLFFWFILRIIFHYSSDVCVFSNIMLAFNRASSWHKRVKKLGVLVLKVYMILQKHRHSQTYSTVIFCKVQKKSHFVQDGIYTFGQLQLKFKPEHK